MSERKFYFGDDQDAYTMEEIREALEFKNGVSINADEINSGRILNIRDEFKWDITFGDDETKYSYDEIVEALREREVRRWVPVKERLPEITEHVLISCKRKGKTNHVFFGFRTPSGWFSSNGYIREEKVYAWMPLPEPYVKGVEDDQR